MFIFLTFLALGHLLENGWVSSLGYVQVSLSVDKVLLCTQLAFGVTKYLLDSTISKTSLQTIRHAYRCYQRLFVQEQLLLLEPP